MSNAISRRLMLALVMLFAGLWLVVGCSSDGPQSSLTGQQKTAAINQITALDEVVDAFIEQPNKKTLSLAVTVISEHQKTGRGTWGRAS